MLPRNTVRRRVTAVYSCLFPEKDSKPFDLFKKCYFQIIKLKKVRTEIKNVSRREDYYIVHKNYCTYYKIVK